MFFYTFIICEMNACKCIKLNLKEILILKCARNVMNYLIFVTDLRGHCYPSKQTQRRNNFLDVVDILAAVFFYKYYTTCVEYHKSGKYKDLSLYM